MMERIQINDSAPRGTFLRPFPRHCDTPLYVIASVAKQSSAFPAETGLPRFFAEPRNDGGGPSPRRQDCRGSLRNLAMTEAGLPRGARIAAVPYRTAQRRGGAVRRETGLPRFLAEPRNDGGGPSPRRQDCRGSLRNLAMTGTCLPRGDRIATVPYGTSQ